MKKDSIFRKLCKLICHQRENRCFKYKNYTFPICSRCVGLIIGFIFTLLHIINDIYLNLSIAIIFISIMFFDWIIQFVNIKESTNIRRLITGLIGGTGLTYLYYYIIIYIKNFLVYYN